MSVLVFAGITLTALGVLVGFLQWAVQKHLERKAASGRSGRD